MPPTRSTHERTLMMPPVTPRTAEEAERAAHNVRKLARDDQDAAYLLEVLGLIEATVRTTPLKLSSRDKAAGAPRATVTKTARHHVTVEEHDQRLDLLNEGLRDREIGERVGVPRTHVNHWRHKNGLRANRDPKVGLKPNEQARRDAHAKGWTDTQIAEAENTHREMICQWRHRRGLAVNAERP